MMMMTMIMVLNVCMAYDDDDDDVAMLVRMNRIWISEWMDRYFFRCSRQRRLPNINTFCSKLKSREWKSTDTVCKIGKKLMEKKAKMFGVLISNKSKKKT